MTLYEQIFLKLIPEFVKLASSTSKDRTGENINRGAAQIEHQMLEHMQWQANWCEEVSFYGMPRPQETSKATIDLSFLNTPRRFQNRSRNYAFCTEEDILSDNNHCLILGDPGAGKTTTMKRIVHKYISGASNEAIDANRYPFVLLLRNVENSKCVCEIVADRVGIPYIKKKVESKFKNNAEDTAEYSDKKIDTPDYVSFFGEEQLRKFIPRLLDEHRVLLILDGIDEIRSNDIQPLIDSIDALGQNMNRAKIIATCRSGFVPYISGFSTYELSPLTSDQIKSIVKSWTDRPSDFLKNIENKNYEDLVNRPLLLCQLIVLYNHRGELPDKSTTVYRKLIRLLIEDWDEKRGINRQSKYSGFDVDSKLDFLSSLAYHLNYMEKIRSFSEADLLEIYRLIHDQFGLPLKEAKDVAEELETHTGIIVECEFSTYEFSHLSIQEYLSARHIVRNLDTKVVISDMAVDPSPVAVAIAMSSDASRVLASILLNDRFSNLVSNKKASGFIRRLALENPGLRDNEELGEAILKLASYYHEHVVDSIIMLCDRNASAGKSVRKAFRNFSIEAAPGEPGVRLFRIGGLDKSQNGERFSESLMIPKALIAWLQT